VGLDLGGLERAMVRLCKLEVRAWVVLGQLLESGGQVAHTTRWRRYDRGWMIRAWFLPLARVPV